MCIGAVETIAPAERIAQYFSNWYKICSMVVKAERKGAIIKQRVLSLDDMRGVEICLVKGAKMTFLRSELGVLSKGNVSSRSGSLKPLSPHCDQGGVLVLEAD